MKEKDYIIWLKSIHGVGDKISEGLMKYFGSAEAVFHAPKDTLYGLKGINHDTIHNIVQNRDLTKVQALTENVHKHNIDILHIEDEEYPDNLMNIYSPPLILYKKGNILDRDVNAIAIVGSRKASSYGKWAAYKFASELAKKGVTIISGMAYGVDTFAHRGALEHGGRTIAVLGCGLDTCYPKSNYSLMLEIQKNGAVISEYGLGVKPMSQNFPPRNRIISGIAKGVVVIEASLCSGSLITAEFALDQGREVFAVPGNINSSLSTGTHKLIKEGAKLVSSTEDILEELDIVIHENDQKVPIELSKQESEIFNIVLKKQPVHMDALTKELKLNIDKISSIITILQLKGLIDQMPGKILIIKEPLN